MIENHKGVGEASDLASRTSGAVRSALGWNLANHGLSQLVTVGVFLFLASRLDPAVFGVFALATIVVEAVATEARIAMIDLIVVRREFSRVALSTSFLSAMAGAAAAYLLVVLASPILGAVLGVPSLGAVATVLGLAILAAPLLAVYEALLLKDLRFGLVAARNLTATLVSAAATVSFAIHGPEEWSLVVQRLSAILAGLLVLAPLARWTPSFAFDRNLAQSSLRPFWSLWLGQMINFGLNRAPDLLIGVRLGPELLGVYRVAARVVDMVLSAVTAPLSGVFIPVLTQFAHDRAGQAEQYKQIAALSALLTAPALVGLALISRDLTPLVLDARYAQAGIVVTMLAVAGLAAPFAHFRGGILVAAGRPGLAAALALLDLATTAVAVWIGAGFGLAQASAAVLAASMVAAAVSAFAVARVLDASMGALLRSSAPPFVAAVVMAAALAAGAPIAADWPGWIRVGAAAGLGAAVFGSHLALLHLDWVRARVAYLLKRDGKGGDDIEPPLSQTVL